jgi:hypothetical protein
MERSPFPSNPTPEDNVLAPLGLPNVHVESVRWHPDSRRREARVQVEQVGPLDVREGDIVAGVLIESIHPAEVEIRVGARTGKVPLRP